MNVNYSTDMSLCDNLMYHVIYHVISIGAMIMCRETNNFRHSEHQSFIEACRVHDGHLKIYGVLADIILKTSSNSSEGIFCGRAQVALVHRSFVRQSSAKFSDNRRRIPFCQIKFVRTVPDTHNDDDEAAGISLLIFFTDKTRFKSPRARISNMSRRAFAVWFPRLGEKISTEKFKPDTSLPPDSLARHFLP